MKRFFVLLIAVIMAFALVACGGDTKPTVDIADIGGGQEAADTASPTPSQPNALPEVEVKGDRLLQTADDGAGNTTVTEYIYKDGTLSEMLMTMKCADTVVAKALVDAYTTGELKEHGAQLYSEIKQDGKDVRFKFQESHLASFAGLSMEQLTALLEGKDPISEATPDNGGGETKINTAWDAMALPDGFPKLADGATNYSNTDSLITISWNAMPKSDVDSMVQKLEKWAGATAEKAETDGAVSWNLDGGGHIVDISYYPDTFGGAMEQVMLSIVKF